jgi:hypothetical protein
MSQTRPAHRPRLQVCVWVGGLAGGGVGGGVGEGGVGGAVLVGD